MSQYDPCLASISFWSLAESGLNSFTMPFHASMAPDCSAVSESPALLRESATTKALCFLRPLEVSRPFHAAVSRIPPTAMPIRVRVFACRKP